MKSVITTQGIMITDTKAKHWPQRFSNPHE